MLVGQAARSLEIWTGREISENAMRQGAKLALS
jgi:shikimate 5-dehydrogenase